jgi:hypothetical protein
MMYMHMHPVKAPTINLGEGKWFHCSQKFGFFLNINQVKKNSYEKSKFSSNFTNISCWHWKIRLFISSPPPLKKKVNGCSLNETVVCVTRFWKGVWYVGMDNVLSLLWSDGHQFHQFQQNKQSPLISTDNIAIATS